MHPNPLGKQIGATFFHELPVPPPPPAPRVVVGAEAVRAFTLMMVMSDDDDDNHDSVDGVDDRWCRQRVAPSSLDY